MKVGIHQPYLFPYLGYFQLIAAVDRFVIYDDVQFIKGGWINRNNIIGAAGAQLFTLELHEASPNKLINQISIGRNAAKLVKTISQTYRRAPRWTMVMPEIESCLLDPERNLARFTGNSVRRICSLLGIRTEILISSELAAGIGLSGQDRVLAICRALGASHYLNAIGGSSLYDDATFSAAGIRLGFLRMGEVAYRQFTAPFVPRLSIIDVLMFNPPEAFPALLATYTEVRHDDS
jgi:hypothetical protein